MKQQLELKDPAEIISTRSRRENTSSYKYKSLYDIETSYGSGYYGSSYYNFSRVSQLDIKEVPYNEKPAYVLQYMPTDLKKAIQDKVLSKIGGSEFQLNAIYLVIETNKFDFAITLGYTTFKQSVSGASVSYSGDNINEYTNKFLEKYPIAALANKVFIPRIVNKIKSAFPDIKIERTYITKFNSIHRHPGRFSFSSIDKSLDKHEPGVLYLNSHLDNIAVVDSVVYVSNTDGIEIIDTWYRKGNIKPDEEGNPSGEYKRYTNVTVLTNITGDFNNKDIYLFSPSKFIKVGDISTVLAETIPTDILEKIPYTLDVSVIDSGYTFYKNNKNINKDINSTKKSNKKNNINKPWWKF